METKYMVTAHVHAGEKHWRIPVPINFLAAGLENQLVFYWTRADDLQRTLDLGQKSSFKFSFSVEPQDCKLQVPKFGVRFIHKEDIMQLKKLEDSTTDVVNHLFGATFTPIMHSSEDLICLRCCQSSINHNLTRSITTFICDYGKRKYALVDMHKVVESLIEINQEVLSECKEEWSHTELFPLFYDYYRIIHGTSELYDDFLRLLKHASNSWLSVKLALEQILAKSRTDTDYSYREMLEQLNDLEASEGIKFSDNFITTFAYLCKQTLAFSRHFNEKLEDIEKFKSANTLAKVSSITIAGIFCILTTYMCSDKLSQETEGAGSYSMWLHLIHGLLNKQGEWFHNTGSYGRELQIWEFLDCAIVVQELKMEMARFASFSHQNEKEMIIVINKLEKMMDNISVTIEDMCRHAHLYSLDVKEVGITLNQFIVNSNLQFSVSGVRFMLPGEEQQCESPMSKAMSVMYRATLSLIQSGLQWYICACEEKEADGSSLLSCHSSIHDNTSNILRIRTHHYPIEDHVLYLKDVQKVITCLHAINQEGFTVLSVFKEEWKHHPQVYHLVNDYHKVCLQTSQLYNDFVRLMKGQCVIGLGAILRLKEVVVNCRQDEKMILGFDDDGSFTLSGDFMKSLADICKQTVAFTGQFNEEILELKSVKVLAKVSSGLIACVFSLMTAYMVDLGPFQWTEEKPLTSLWLHLYRCFSWKGPLVEIGQTVKNDILGIDSYIAAEKMHELSVTIEELSRHADTLNDDIMKSLKKLRILDMSGSWSLTKTDNFSGLENLEELYFKYCKNLKDLHGSIGDLEKLAILDLRVQRPDQYVLPELTMHPNWIGSYLLGCVGEDEEMLENLQALQVAN
ncbi:uncharacterized protein LOC143539089 [Bidens hawaiensis]|uniref:uncharacterized protein LOC143539089 n=1 Tax=Bidens hawaiensis TaxID=980011 RepID=UPI004049B586